MFVILSPESKAQSAMQKKWIRMEHNTFISGRITSFQWTPSPIYYTLFSRHVQKTGPHPPSPANAPP
jgi:hypothetical protein